MNSRLVCAFETIEIADTVEAVWKILVDAVTIEGFNVAVYVTVASKPPANPFFLSNMPPEWTTGFQDNLGVFDPFLEHCCSTYEITPTGVEFMDDYPYLDEGSKRFISAAAEIGFRSGFGIPMRLQGAPRYGGFNLGTGLDRAQFESELSPKAESLRALCLIAHRRIEELAQNSATAMRVKALSFREKQCVTLLAGGLQVQRIAEHLELSDAAIRLYVKNAKSKLGANTREELIAIAMAQGLLER